MDGHAAKQVLTGLLWLGALLGVALCGVLYGCYWLWSHVRIAWVP